MTKLSTRFNNFLELEQGKAAITTGFIAAVATVATASLLNWTAAMILFFGLAPIVGIYGVGLYNGRNVLDLFLASVVSSAANIVANLGTGAAVILFFQGYTSQLIVDAYNLATLGILYFFVYYSYQHFVIRGESQ